MLKHVVLFSLDGFETQEEKLIVLAKIKVELERLPESISALRSMKVSVNENPKESYDFMLEALVGSIEALPLYADHPDHVEVVRSLIKPYLKARACVDYSVE